jgi:hypothetical protein
MKLMKLSDLGLKEGINEVIGITHGVLSVESGEFNLNAAPLGLIVGDESGIDAEVRLYSNHTRENFERSGELWVNVIHDPVLFVISAFEDPGREWYESLQPPILKGALTVCRFSGKLEKGGRGRVIKLRLEEGKVLKREIRAVNRGFNLLIEALIYATRLHLNPNYASRILELEKIIEKCGGKREKEALLLLKEYIKHQG